MADITGAAVRALAFSLFSKAARRQQVPLHGGSDPAAVGAGSSAAASTPEVCRQRSGLRFKSLLLQRCQLCSDTATSGNASLIIDEASLLIPGAA